MRTLMSDIDNAYYFISLPCKFHLPCMFLTVNSDLLLHMDLNNCNWLISFSTMDKLYQTRKISLKLTLKLSSNLAILHLLWLIQLIYRKNALNYLFTKSVILPACCHTPACYLLLCKCFIKPI